MRGSTDKPAKQRSRWDKAGGYLSLLLLALVACRADPPPETGTAFAELPPREEDYATGVERWGYIDRTGEVIIAADYDDNRPFGEGRAVVRRGGRFGYVDRTGRLVIPLRFAAAYRFREGRARVRTTTDSVGFIDRNGSWVVPPTWADAGDFSQGLARVSRAGRWGYVDTSGQVRIEPGYEVAEDFTPDGRAIVGRAGRYGMIDRAGKPVIEPRFERLFPFREGWARARSAGRYGYIDTTGSWVIDPAFAQGSDFHGDYAAVQDEEENWRLIDRTGTLHPRGPFQQLWYGGDSLWIGDRQGKYGAWHPERGTVIPFQFEALESFSEGWAPFALEGRWGYVGSDGSVLTAPAFYLAWPFRNGLARVALNTGIGFIDTTGRLAIPPRYLDARDFSEGRAQVLVR